jgi:hypothetical protein
MLKRAPVVSGHQGLILRGQRLGGTLGAVRTKAGMATEFLRD